MLMVFLLLLYIFCTFQITNSALLHQGKINNSFSNFLGLFFPTVIK